MRCDGCGWVLRYGRTTVSDGLRSYYCVNKDCEYVDYNAYSGADYSMYNPSSSNFDTKLDSIK